MKWHVRLVSMGVATLLVFLLGGCSAPVNSAASFGNHVITEDEVSAYTASYRAQNGLEGDEEWSSFVLSGYQDVKTWREEAIRVLADRILIKEKAAELGIVADESTVDQTIAEDKEKAGVSPADEQAWIDYLAQRGSSPQDYRDKLVYSSIEEQVYRRELNFTDELLDEMCNQYIKQNFAAQFMRHYWAISFEFNEGEQARACLDELNGLSDGELRKRFIEEYDQAVGMDAGSAGYDIGWDFLYSESTIDPDIYLRSANLHAGELYDKVLKGADKLRVVMCDERVELEGKDYDSIESESFKQIISAYALATLWSGQCNDYLSELENAANVKVMEMPEGLPYDIS